MSLNEDQTRQQLIDRQLAQAGWGAQERSVLTEYYLRNPEGSSELKPAYSDYSTGFADYVLLGRDGRPIAVVEAKRTSRDSLVGKRQAADYADQLKVEFGYDPFIFLTNGQTILFWDRDRYPPREVSGFFSREDLERLSYQKRYSQPLKKVEQNAQIAGRDYQIGSNTTDY